jgi:hypothetical protein
MSSGVRTWSHSRATGVPEGVGVGVGVAEGDDVGSDEGVASDVDVDVGLGDVVGDADSASGAQPVSAASTRAPPASASPAVERR